jgi:hypothetical protein
VNLPPIIETPAMFDARRHHRPTRRNFLHLGMLGGAGFSMADYFRLAAADGIRQAPATSAIFVHLAGGPSHLDSFDPKPNAPVEYRGEFATTATKVPGIELCEHLPKLAKCTHHFAVLRGVSHTQTEHAMGIKYMNTGNRPLPSLEYPGYGAVVSKELVSPPDLPPFVAIPKTPQIAGALGIEYAPLSTQSVPRAGQAFTVRGLELSRSLNLDKLQRRRQLLEDLEAGFERYEQDSGLLRGMDEFSRRAHEIIRSPKAKLAFDTSREPASIAKLFDDTPISQGCLLATRLVEAGVRFVTVEHGGWDTHDHNFTQLKNKLLPELDGGLSGLLAALDTKGLLASTAVFVTGEFGRTPKISTQRVGRDHYPRAMFVLLAGGGMKGGQVLGGSDSRGEAPADGRGFSPDDVAASFYYSLGIDARKEYRTPTGRPVALVREGQLIEGLF